MPTQHSKRELFFFWLQWVLMNTFAWLFSWAVMKYVLNIHPEHPSAFWFFIIGVLISFTGQWLIIKKMFADKYSDGFPLQATPDIGGLTGEFIIFPILGIGIIQIFSISFGLDNITSILLPIYIVFSSIVFQKYIKRTPGRDKFSIASIILFFVIFILAVVDIFLGGPITWFNNQLGLNIFSFSTLIFVISGMISGVILTKINDRLPDDLPKAEPKKDKLTQRILSALGIIIVIVILTIEFFTFSPEIYSPCNFFNSRIINNDCIQSWRDNHDSYGVSLSPDGSHIAILIDRFIPEYNGIKVLDILTADVIAELDLSDWVAEKEYSVEFSYSPNQNIIAIFIPENQEGKSGVLLWDYENDNIEPYYFPIPIDSYGIYLKFSSNGRFLGLTLNKEFYIFEIEEGTITQDYHIAFEERIRYLDFFKTDERVTFIVDWEDVYEWDFTSQNPPRIVSEGEYRNIVTALDSEENYLVAWVEDGILKLWNGGEVFPLILVEDQASDIAGFSPNGEYLLVVNDGKFWVFRTSDGVLLYSEIYMNNLYQRLKSYSYIWDVVITDSGIVVIRTSEELQVWEVLP